MGSAALVTRHPVRRGERPAPGRLPLIRLPAGAAGNTNLPQRAGGEAGDLSRAVALPLGTRSGADLDSLGSTCRIVTSRPPRRLREAGWPTPNRSRKSPSISPSDATGRA